MLLKDIILKNKNSTKIAIKDSKENLLYKSLYEQIHSSSEKLCDYKKYSKNMGIFIPNSVSYAVAYFSITLLNSVIVPISIQTKKKELESTIDYCELGIIITNSVYKEKLKDLLNKSYVQVYVYNLDDNSLESLGNSEYKINLSDSKSFDFDENDTALMLHTSGTTSNPKRVMLTHKNLLSNIKSNIESLDLSSNDKVLISLPMFFGYCNTAQFLTHLYLGTSIVIMDGLFIPDFFFKLVQEEKITNYTGVPTNLLMLLNCKNKGKYDISSLRYICFGGGRMPIEKLKLLVKTFPKVGFVQTYGQTEASPRVTALLPQDSVRKLGSVGKPIPNVSVRIIDENGIDVNVNQLGEIIVKGDNVMKGYYKRITETSKAIKNGWLYTGDIGKYDQEGFIYIVGRKRNMIISGGINIYAEEIEEILMCHPAVKNVLIVGEEDKLLGEVPIAKIELNDEVKITKAELTNYCIDNLTLYKVPKRIDFVTSFIKTTTGKLKRI